MELSGWGPLIAMWLGSLVYFAMIVRAERKQEPPREIPRRHAA
jgi:hypothetical protein